MLQQVESLKPTTDMRDSLGFVDVTKFCMPSSPVDCKSGGIYIPDGFIQMTVDITCQRSPQLLSSFGGTRGLNMANTDDDIIELEKEKKSIAQEKLETDIIKKTASEELKLGKIETGGQNLSVRRLIV